MHTALKVLRALGAGALALFAITIAAMMSGDRVLEGYSGYLVVLGLFWMLVVVARIVLPSGPTPKRPQPGQSKKNGAESSESDFYRSYRASTAAPYWYWGGSSNTGYE